MGSRVGSRCRFLVAPTQPPPSRGALPHCFALHDPVYGLRSTVPECASRQPRATRDRSRPGWAGAFIFPKGRAALPRPYPLTIEREFSAASRVASVHGRGQWTRPRSMAGSLGNRKTKAGDTPQTSSSWKAEINVLRPLMALIYQHRRSGLRDRFTSNQNPIAKTTTTAAEAEDVRMAPVNETQRKREKR